MLARLYIEREDLEMARERLLEAKHLNPRISITAGLEAVRRVAALECSARRDSDTASGGGAARDDSGR